MTREQIAAIPRLTVDEMLAAIPAGPGYHDRQLAALESALNVQWWRGYHSGHAAAKAGTKAPE
jgi:hypothetical protein